MPVQERHLGRVRLRGAAVLIAAAALSVAVLSAGCDVDEAPQRVTIAVPRTVLNAGIHLAVARGLFAAEGLEVEIVETASGQEATRRVVAGDADFATASETVLMHEYVDGLPIVILATIGEALVSQYVVASAASGIAAPADLAGKRIAYPPGTSAEYFLHAFLLFHDVPLASVVAVPRSPEQLAPALAAGEADAVAVWHPYAGTAESALGAGARVFTSAAVYAHTWNLMTSEATPRRSAAVGILRALAAANRLLEEEPGALASVATEIGIAPEHIAAMRGASRFDLRLGQDLVLSIESQARLLRGATGASFETLLQRFDPRPLQAVDPGAATVIR